ncbi:MAG: aconitase X [Clostridiales Family XIII bacterium]|jgi:hypothetical protein|nr:aconitase X [Clostridiales Family XIII bacterium]
MGKKGCAEKYNFPRCPHYSLEEIWRVSMRLEGKRIAGNSNLWIFAPNAIRAMADRAGYTAIIERAGAYIMCDTCPCIAEIAPAGTKVFATDSPKQAHHMHSIMGLPAWYGSTEDCIDAALGALVSHVPAMTDFDVDPLSVIETGDWVKVDADSGTVEIEKKGGRRAE